ncbi:MAG: hypothetical protein JWL90_1091 [Chthoniobacteraceae bacterium]|nr:hypothetical protein [Chthoniobacteraceae bacterium]
MLAQKVIIGLHGEIPDALILFVSPRYNLRVLVQALTDGCHPAVLVGCSSAGEFTSQMHGDGRACAIAIRSSELKFAAGIGRGIGKDRAAAAKAVVSAFSGSGSIPHAYSSGLVLTDALAGHADELIEQLTICTGGNYQFFGGGAGDDARFQQTQVILGTEVATDAAVVLEILSHKPIGVGVRHGWRPAGKPMRVTESNGPVLVSLNAMRAVDVFAEHAASTGQEFDPANPLPFFLHNILGIDTGENFRLRVPLAIGQDGSVTCAAEIPPGALVCIMGTDALSARNAAADATRDAVNQLQGNEPKFALFFDCVATRLRMGKEFGYELDGLKEALGSIQFAGCNTYGQVARSEGQFSGFHNCTAVVCVFPA